MVQPVRAAYGRQIPKDKGERWLRGAWGGEEQESLWDGHKVSACKMAVRVAQQWKCL